MKGERLRPSVIVALLPIAFLIVMLSMAVSLFGSSSLEGANQMALLLTSALCIAIGMGIYGVPWKSIEDCMVGNIGGVASAIIILFIIGALSGMWMVSGVVPTLIYYGLDLLSPRFFLVSCCMICSIVSVMTGSSWTTVATIGIALMGIGRAMGYNDGWIAGAIISGAYFGDKISPLSDTTVLVASTCRLPLFAHIKYMLITTVPSITVALAVFLVAGMMHTVSGEAQMDTFSASLASRFLISPWLLAVPIATAILISRRVPSIITLFLSTAMAMVAAVLAQPDVLQEIAGGNGVAKGVMMSFYGPTSVDVPNEMLRDLIATRGMAGMMNTVWLILCAIIFGAAMQATGMLDAITSTVVRTARGAVSLVAGTVITGLFLNTTTSDQYLSLILNGKMYADVYRHKGYEARLLSRAVEDGTTVTSVLIPWNTCGMTQATVLGVATLAYLPYTVFCYISPIMSILMATLRFKVYRTQTATP